MRYTVAELVAILAMDASKFEKGIKSAELTTSQMVRNLEKISKQAMKYITLPLVGFGVAATKMAMDFETQITALHTIMDETTFKSRDWSQEVINLSKKIGESTSILADGLYYLVGSGVDAADAIGVLEIAAKSAKAGFTDTATAVRALASILNSYQLSAEDAEKVSDILFATVNYGVITYEELATGIGTVLPIAAAANVSLEELGAAITVLTLGGIGADEAMTALRATILALLDPTPQAVEVAQELGFNLSATALASDGLYGTLKKMTNALGLTTEAMEELNDPTLTEADLQKLLAERAGTTTEKIAKMFPNVRALVGVLSLVKGEGEEFAKQMDNMAKTAGTLENAFSKVAETTKFQFDLALSSLRATSIEIGTKLLPIATKLFKALGGIAGKFGELSEGTQDAIIKFATFIAIVPPVVYAGTKIYFAIKKIRDIMLLLKITGLELFGIGGLITWLGLLFYETNRLMRQSEEFKNLTEDQVEIIKELTGVTVKQYDATKETADEIDRYTKKIMGWSSANADLILILDELNYKYEIGEITIGEYRRALEFLIRTKGEYKGTTEAVLKNIEKSERALNLEIRATKGLKEASEESIPILDETGKVIGYIGDEAEETAQTIENLISLMFSLFNIEQSTTEATWRYEEALKEVEEMIKRGITSGKDYEQALFDLQDARENLMVRIAENLKVEDLSIERQTELKNKYIELSDAAIKSGETTVSAWWDMTKEAGMVSDEIGEYLMDIGLKAVENGDISVERFKEMLRQFNETSEGIKYEIETVIVPGFGEVIIKGREITENPPKIDMKDNFAGVIKRYQEMERQLKNINRTVTYTYLSQVKTTGTFGEREYGLGGIVGLPKAQYGYIAPQRGREIPVIAHPYEVLLNTSEQKNIAEWIMRKATTRPQGMSRTGDIYNYFKIATLAVREEADVEKVATVLHEKQIMEQRGGGNK